MIDLSDDARAVLTGSYRMSVRVESWLDEQLLSDDVPISAGSEEADRSLRIPERVTLTVPRRTVDFDWTPDYDDHPLAANGQRLRIFLGIDLGNGVLEWFNRGEFVIFSTTFAGNTVTVDARGLLNLIDEARLVAPYQPSGTIVSTLRGLLEPALTITVDAGLVDRSVPAGVNYDEDRLGAVLEILDAWPAEATVTADGYLAVVPVSAPTAADLVLARTGATRTLIDAGGEVSRDGAVSVVVARGTAADGGQVQGAWYDQSAGPHRYGGPFNPLPVPEYFYSPLLTTIAQCNAAATTIGRRKLRESARPIRVEMVPRPDLQIGDAVSVDGVLCTLETYGNLPYTAATSPMTATFQPVTSW